MASAAQEALAWSLWVDGELLVSPDGLAVQGVKKKKTCNDSHGPVPYFLKGDPVGWSSTRWHSHYIYISF